ncbi:hypothetical protein LEP1GSC125_2758 [Leptospira mayottensis 200901122]|uniref:Uncharacterized protein n=1 Tax=Leptospira mayottensis 200901122 TaxID=1193010 RepID=A0AA87MQQ3_9LEPT|nr:hypothetical protein LEP1GSC125_2758 [Leptospira mayottensis 200901122]
MKKTKIDWAKEFDDFSKSGLSQPQYCKRKTPQIHDVSVSLGKAF